MTESQRPRSIYVDNGAQEPLSVEEASFLLSGTIGMEVDLYSELWVLQVVHVVSFHTLPGSPIRKKRFPYDKVDVVP